MIRNVFWRILAAGLWTLPMLGQPATEREPETPTVHEEMAVTAQFEPESAKESLYPVRIFSRERIENQAADNLRELLNFGLTLDIDQHSVFGSSLSIDGVSGENLKILVDGAPVIGRLDGIIDLEQIDLDAVRQVELIEGPVSVYYGTDALAGVVNVISHTPTREGWRGAVASGYESAGDWRRSAKVDYAHGVNALTVHLGGRDFDGSDDDAADRGQDWSERRQDRGGLTLSRRMEALTLTYRGRYFEERLETLGEANAGQAIDRAYDTRRASHAMSLTGFAARGLYLDAALSFADYERAKSSTRLDLASGRETTYLGPGAEDFTGFRHWLARGLATWRNAGPRVQIQAGFEASVERGRGGRLQDGRQETADGALFAGLRYETAGGFSIQPAVRFNHNSDYDAPPVPALHLKYDASERWTWRGSYVRGFRGPSLKELFLDFAMPAGPAVYVIEGNEALAAERGHDAQLSMQTVQPLARGHWRGEATLFFNDIDDKIALSNLAPDPQNPRLLRRRYINLADHRARGGRVSLRFRAGRWQLGAGLARVETANQLAEATNAPSWHGSWRMSADASWRPWGDRTAISLFFKRHGRQSGFFEETGAQGDPVVRETRLAAYSLLDANLSWRPLREGPELQAGIKNLLDVRNRDEAALTTGQAHETHILGYGRIAFVNARWSW